MACLTFDPPAKLIGDALRQELADVGVVATVNLSPDESGTWVLEVHVDDDADPEVVAAAVAGHDPAPAVAPPSVGELVERIETLEAALGNS